jgi:succinate-semialdehyde dehydrogenase/glutarate-semialdehyde dehydrogenase
MAGEAERTHGSTVEGANPANRLVIIKQPLGVVGCLTAWNFPVALLVRKVSTALAAGCTVVAKPSPETPISAVAVAILAQRAGFPAVALMFFLVT